MVTAISRLPIRTKILSSSIVTLLLICAVLLSYYPYAEKKEINLAMQKNFHSMADMIALGVGVGMQSNNFEMVIEALKWSKQDPDLVYIAVLDENQEVFGSYNPSDTKLSIQYLLENDDIVEHDGRPLYITKVSITYKQAGYGMLIMVTSLEQHYQRIGDKRIRALLVSVAIFLVGLLLSFFFSRTITKPLINLQRAAQSIAKGDYDIAIEEHSENEIGVLGQSFHEMAKKTKLLISRLEDEINESKRAEEAVRSSEAKFRLLFENVREGVYQSTPDGKLLTVNPAFVRMFGYGSEAEMLSVDIARDLYANPADREKTIQHFSEKDNLQDAEVRLLKKSGEEMLVLENGGGVRNEEGIVLYYQGTLTDITERKRAEKARLAIETKYKQLVQQAVDGIFITDTEGNLLLVNQKSCEMLGYTEEELLRINIADTYPVEEKSLAFERMRGMSPGKTMQFERHMQRKDGSIFAVEVSLGKLRDGGFQGIVRDVTERKRAEESIQKLLHAVEQSDEVIFMTDLQGTITYVNPAFERVYGFTKEKALGNTPRILRSGLTTKAQYESYWHDLLSRKNVRIEFVNKSKDGRLVTVDVSVNPIFEGDGKISGFIAVQKDITERKKMEEEKTSLQQQLFQAQKLESLGTLAGGIAHDFNNILGIILGYASFIQPGKLDQITLSASTGAITKAAQRGANLVRQILTFARKTDAALEPVNVNIIIEELSKMLRETFPKTTGIALQLDTTVPVITTDHTQLHQALLNLCVNARDAMNDPSSVRTPSEETTANVGTLSIRTEMIGGDTVRTLFADARESQYICISVSDTGTGMDEATKQRIFEPFFTTKELGKGTGLGLAVVYGVVKRHQGFVDVESEVGRGTTFRLYLPIPASIIGSTVTEEKKSAEVIGGTETILLVEDEESLLDLMKTALENKGYRVVTAQDGIEAIRVYAQYKESIALVVTDMGLPKLDGQGVVTALLGMNPQLGVIIASGFLDPDVQSELSKAGVKEFVHKPYAFAKMLTKVREVIEHGNGTRAYAQTNLAMLNEVGVGMSTTYLS